MKSAKSKKLQRKEKKKKLKQMAPANLLGLNNELDNTISTNVAKDEEHCEQLTCNSNDIDEGSSCVTSLPLNKKLKLTNDDSVNASKENEKHNNSDLTEQVYKDLKQNLKQRSVGTPQIQLNESGEKALLSVNDDLRIPIFLTDIQHLIMKAVLNDNSPCDPNRWCILKKIKHITHTVVVTIEGISLYDYYNSADQFTDLQKVFTNFMEVIMPTFEDGMLLKELCQVPLTCLQAENLISQHGSLEAAIELNKDPTLLIQNIFPITNEPNAISDEMNNVHPNDKFPRTKLLLSALQMVEEGYPMPLKGGLSSTYSTYVFTKEKYAPVTNRSPLFGLDCEMCRTILGINELTRISIVNENLETVYETLVRPTNKIVNYLTRYSGITAEIMETVTKTLKDVQKEVTDILPPDAILVGQSLNCDLNAMQMMHPYVIDTSICFNISGVRKRKSKLQTLASTYLKETIQEQCGGHDSVEDSISSLKLIKMKLANSVHFGDEVLIRKQQLHQIFQAAKDKQITNNLIAHATQSNKHTALITANPLPSSIENLLKKCTEQPQTQSFMNSINQYEMQSNKLAVRKTREVCTDNALTITNLHFDEQTCYPNNLYDTMVHVNKAIRKIWKSVAERTLFVVLMGASKQCNSGLTFFAIKHHEGKAIPNELEAQK